MTYGEVKQRLITVLDSLPPDKAEAVLDFAQFLQQQVEGQPATPEDEWDEWERAIIAAEEYWFSLPEETRQGYIGKTVAVVEGRILDADRDRSALQERVRGQYPDQPVLYIEGEAKYLEPLVVRSPRLK
jgi:hypothetical protein